MHVIIIQNGQKKSFCKTKHFAISLINQLPFSKMKKKTIEFKNKPHYDSIKSIYFTNLKIHR